MKMKKILALSLVLITLCSLAACGQSGSSAQGGSTSETAAASAETIQIILGSSASSTQHNENTKAFCVAENYWIDNLHEATDGRYDIKYICDGQLASNKDEYMSGLKDGSIGMTIFVCAAISGYTNAFAELSVPFLYSSYDEVYSILDGGLEDTILKNYTADTGTVGLGMVSDGFRQITGAKATIKTASDLKGKKYRVLSDQALMAGFEALGTAVTSIPTEELYTSLQQGLVDGQENVYSSMLSLSLYEVQPYITITNHYATFQVMAMNQEMWNGLSEEDQQIFMEVAKGASEAARDALTQMDEDAIAELKELGVTFYTPTEEEMASFRDPVKEAAWPVAEEVMGTDRWDNLMSLTGESA